MNNEMMLASIIYLAVFRISIIFVGAMSIFLGYKLFVKGITSSGESDSGIEASIGGTQFNLTNAAPGTLFALFGIIVISTMIVDSPPEVSYGNKTQTNSVAVGNEVSQSSEEWAVRGGNSGEEGSTLDAALNNKEDKKLAVLLNNYAWKIYKEGDVDSAAIYARLAYSYDPEHANIIDTLAELLFEQSRFSEALEFKQKAANKDPKYKQGIEKYEAAINE